MDYLQHDGNEEDIHEDIFTQNLIDYDESIIELSLPVPCHTDISVGGIDTSSGRNCKPNPRLIKIWQRLVCKHRGAPASVPVYSHY